MAGLALRSPNHCYAKHAKALREPFVVSAWFVIYRASARVRVKVWMCPTSPPSRPHPESILRCERLCGRRGAP
eukprot:2510041-Alexandrium_andersonii.AAC.1